MVLIKQVPATDKVKMDEETGTMIRDGIESEINPLDLYAIEEAVRIKERVGTGVRGQRDLYGSQEGRGSCSERYRPWM